jgi:transcriptional regulator with XRE-family HTH domain
MEDRNRMSLKEHRRRAYLTIEALAAKAGVSKDTIVRIEIGKRPPKGVSRPVGDKDPGQLRMQTMLKIAEALGVKPDDIREFAAEVRK